MPLQEFPFWSILVASGNPDLLSLVGIVRLAVVEVILQFPADKESVIRSDGDVATVIESMDVGSHEDPVVHPIPSPLTNRFDVSGIKDRQCFLPCNSAVPLVHVCDENPKSTLPQPLANQNRITVHAITDVNSRDGTRYLHDPFSYLI